MGAIRCQTAPGRHRVLRYSECSLPGHSRHLGCSFAICSLIRLRKSRGLASPWNGVFKPPVPVIVTEPKLKMRPRCLIVYAKKVGDSFGAVEMNSILTPTSANPIVVIRYFIKMLRKLGYDCGNKKNPANDTECSKDRAAKT